VTVAHKLCQDINGGYIKQTISSVVGVIERS